MPHSIIEDKVREYEKDNFVIHQGREVTTYIGTRSTMLPDEFRQALLDVAQQVRLDTLEETIRVSWDIADGGKEWIVQFWRKDQDGTMTLLTQLDKNSDDGGSFDIASLKQQPL